MCVCVLACFQCFVRLVRGFVSCSSLYSVEEKSRAKENAVSEKGEGGFSCVMLFESVMICSNLKT